MAPLYAIPSEAVAVQCTMVEPDSNAAELKRYTAPYAAPVETVAAQLEMVEPDRDAVEVSSHRAAPALTPPPFRRSTLARCR